MGAVICLIGAQAETHIQRLVHPALVLGSGEAVRRLTVEKMPLTVILDAHGGDLYTSGPAAYLETVK